MVDSDWVSRRGLTGGAPRGGQCAESSCDATYLRAGGMGPPLVFLFFNGVGLMQVLTPSNVYLVDASQTRSAEAVSGARA